MPDPKQYSDTPPKTEPGIAVRTALTAGDEAGKMATLAVVNWLAGNTQLSIAQKLMAVLKQVQDLYEREVFTTGEYRQILVILLAALRRKPKGRRQRFKLRSPRGAANSEVMDAVDVEADPNAADIMDALDCENESDDDELADDEIMDAVDLGDYLDSEDIMDAVDLEDEDSFFDTDDCLDDGDDLENSLDDGLDDDGDGYDMEDQETSDSGMDDKGRDEEPQEMPESDALSSDYDFGGSFDSPGGSDD